ncbi:hypothetical protein EYR36_006993 [Pleurotus pulmonarius]|nr:hypothetical protein EYR36_006993 [Pleurotus pulmonarius]
MARPHDHLPRLNIPAPLNLQQPFAFDRMQPNAMYSPALPTSIQAGFHPPFPMNNSMQTPMQAFFNPQPPNAPGRPTHRQGQASVAQLAAAGIHPPGGFAMTPLGGHFPRHSMAMGPGQLFPGHPGQPFQGKHRKQMSVGGPPKATLGGPGRNHSPLPVPVAAAAAATPQPKAKKVVLNLPKETVTGEDGEVQGRPTWARHPIPMSEVDIPDDILPVEMVSAEIYPPDFQRDHLPDTIEVFLPGKRAWDELKQKAIEEKLERLGVERGSGSNVPHIFAPHARAASISSPADPALLMFKLNKLHQQQSTSATNSLSSSPQPPPFGLSPSPHQAAPRFVSNRHGHSLSLAQPPSQQWPMFTDNSNPFGPTALLGSDHTPYSQPSPGIPGLDISGDSFDLHAPQGRVPITPASLVPPLSAVQPPSRPDFIRGFGLDIPEEEEEPEEEPDHVVEEVHAAEDNLGTDQDGRYKDDDAESLEDMSFVTNDADISHNGDDNMPTEDNTDEMGIFRQRDGVSTVAQSRLHSRHVSRLSGALTLVSVGGLAEDEELERAQIESARRPLEQDMDMDEDAAIEEWTGSEDLQMDIESSDDESIGEWSNPSDEERARQRRLERRARKRSLHHEIQTPRRLPNFPRPPENTIALAFRRDSDDIISNPSEEERIREQATEFLRVDGTEYYQYQPQPSGSGSGSRSPRPLPPLPHSRATSVAQLSSHDPAYAHSRGGSEQSTYPPAQSHQSQPSYSSRRDSLNPFAKPFVFGAPRGSGSWTPQSVDSSSVPPQQSTSTVFGHTRIPSFGKPLNVAAPEFKPGSFSFRLPPGLVKIPLPAPEQPRPLPEIPANTVSGASRQGREKRQRVDEAASPIEEGDSMQSFKFPPSEGTGSMRRASTPKDERQSTTLNPSAEPFTFGGIPFIPQQSQPQEEPLATIESESNVDESLRDDSTARAPNGAPEVEEYALPSASKPKRAPIPLDFKHPVSSNTVPAGLFKALNTEERTRRTVRSRLGSREIDLARRPSLDDMQMPTISRKISRSLLVNGPGGADDRSSVDGEDLEDDVFGSNIAQHKRRRSSLPLPLNSAGSMTSGGISIPAMDGSGRLEIHELEHRLEMLLDDKFASLSNELANKLTDDRGRPFDSSAGEQISEAVALLRAQLRESAIRGMEDSRLDARGELDFDLIRNTIQQAQNESLSLIQRELRSIASNTSSGMASQEIFPLIESFSMRTINAVVEAISELSARLETVERGAPAREHDSLVDKIMTGLIPLLSSLRTDPVDYELLTHQLSQAVKPHISQLIDLASDKRETAGLIVDRIVPLLPGNQGIDTDAITLKLTTEIRRAIAPIDAFEIKEQVADLVVERLDSRLAVRDKALSIDAFSAKVTESVSGLLEPLSDLATKLAKLDDEQSSMTNGQTELTAWSKTITERLTSLANQLRATVEVFNGVEKARAELIDTDNNHVNEAMKIIKSSLDAVQTDMGMSEARDRLSLTSLNETKEITEALSTFIRTGHEDLMKHLARVEEKVERGDDVDELKQENTELQIQLAKARSSHGQVRVEKDLLSEKLKQQEVEYQRLQAKLAEVEEKAAAASAEVSPVQARNKELEEALEQALSRLQASDVASQTYQEQITRLEKKNKDLESEKQSLKTKSESLDVQLTLSKRDKDAAEHSLLVVQQQNDYLTSQQDHWDALKATSAQLDVLTKLVSQGDQEELKELRQVRERSKILESEHTSLLKRFRDQENKATNTEKANNQLRQSLAQNQQRALEWERRAKEYEGQLELTRTQLEQSEQTHSQLEADYSLAKLQLDEREADDRLAKDRENKLNEQIASLESKPARLQSELDKAKRLAIPPSTPLRKLTNGTHVPPRPDSRSSTVYGENRATTPNLRTTSQARSNDSDTPPNQKSVWDSMHAPATYNGYSASIYSPVPSRYPAIGNGTPRGRPNQTSQLSRASVASPTPSIVSQAPTLGEDGWYS